MRMLLPFFAALLLLAVAVSQVWPQFGRPESPAGRPSSLNGLALIDDTKMRSGSARTEDVGRYSITLVNGEAILNMAQPDRPGKVATTSGCEPW